MTENVFTIREKRPIRDGMTISRTAGLGVGTNVTWFSMGQGTSISQERYDTCTLYLGDFGSVDFLLGENPLRVALASGDLLFVPAGTLCGTECSNGSVYTEILMNTKEVFMNNKIQAGTAISLKDVISYETGSIANLDIVKNDSMKFVLMAFDEGTGLSPHRAPGNALITALEGSAVIGYEGKDYTLSAGESFRFDKNGLHSVTAKGKFKMSLLLVLE